MYISFIETESNSQRLNEIVESKQTHTNKQTQKNNKYSGKNNYEVMEDCRSHTHTVSDQLQTS